MIVKKIILLLLFSFLYALKSQNPEFPNPNKKAVRTYVFKTYLNVANGLVKVNYYFFNKKKYKKAKLDTSKFNLVYQDNFDSLDLNKWRIGHPWGYYHPDQPHQYYGKDEVVVENGILKLYSRYSPLTVKEKDSFITFPYSVGLIHSDKFLSQKYGYFEIRSKNPSGPATWPAFWLTGTKSWPPEIDIFEMYGRKDGSTIHNQYITLHYGKDKYKSRGFISKKIALRNNTDKEFHTYACLWTPKKISFYTDGYLVSYIKINKRLKKWLNHEMNVVINNSIDHNFMHYLPKDFKENCFEIDYLKVYQFKKKIN